LFSLYFHKLTINSLIIPPIKHLVDDLTGLIESGLIFAAFFVILQQIELTMKIHKLFLLTIFLAGFSHFSVAQIGFDANTSAEGSITLGSNLRMEKISDLNFGDIVSQSTGGSVRLNPSDGSVSSVSGNFHLMGSSSAAIFEILGIVGQSFLIAPGSYPTQITLTNDQGNTMTVNSFQIIPLSGSLNNIGSALIRIGGTLNIGANQPAGNYINTTDLTIIVSFQ